jgi:hypothetical protein
MPRHVPVSVALLSSLLIATSAVAQPASALPPVRAAAPVSTQVSAAGGQIRGIVRDDIGSAVGGVMVIAVGTTMAAAKSDLLGRYSLALPAGEYILRAARNGYVSTYREPVRMQTSTVLERNITLVRQGAATTDAALVQPLPKEADHAHDEAAWRLRYLPRTVLRDVGAGDAGVVPGGDRSASLADDGDAADTLDALFSSAGINAQVNYLTTSLLPTASPGANAEWMHSVAFASVGAAVGSVGDWTVRGAYNAGDVSAWVLHGEYRSRENQAHQLTLGASRSAQMFAVRPGTLAATDQSRSVGDVYGYDRWRPNGFLQLDYGMRVDRYDYVATPALVSPRAGVRVELLPGTYAVASASYDRVAPGADEFLPPAAAGPWLPPERTFSSLGGAPLDVESAENFEVGFDQRLGSEARARVLSVRRFRQKVEDQAATLFGVDVDGDTSHYYVATPGDVQVDGWSVGVGGDLGARIRGQATYSLAQAAWSPAAGALAVGRYAPSAPRDGHESVHDLTTMLSTRFPATATQLSFVYRMSSAFSQASSLDRGPQLDGRFDIEVRQALPYQPVRGGQLEVLFALRNLFYDAHDARSLYDELLTVKPPLRLVGGIQIRF